METPRFENRENKKSIEDSANYEGNHTLLLVERLQNPEIRNRLIENLYEHATTSENEYFKEKYKTTKEEIAKKLDTDIAEALKSTHIEYSNESNNVFIGANMRDEFLDKKWVVMNLGARHPVTGESYDVKTYNILEAHEKGHFIRYFDPDLDSDFQKRLLDAFDSTKLSYSPEEIEAGKKLTLEHRPKPLTEEQITAAQQKYYPKKTFEWVRDLYISLNKPKTEISDEEILKHQKRYQTDPNELIERMSQLKNYFGMSGTDTFTLEHLTYAREHYDKDTAMRGIMKPFFSMITSEKEEKFIELMNTLGI